MEVRTEHSAPILLDKIPFTVQPETIIKAMRVRKLTHEIENMVREMLEQARGIVRPKAAYMVSPVRRIDDSSVEIGGVRFTSSVLSRCLSGLNRVFPCICTCGQELDGWAAPSNDVMRGYCLDTIKTYALFAAMQYLDNHLKETYSPGKLTHMNPGEFADWPLSQQKPLFSLFGDTEALIGVRLTESNVMKPLKSRSGIYFANEEGFESCQFCLIKKCPGRRARYQPEKLKEYGVREAAAGSSKQPEQEVNDGGGYN